MSRQLSFAGFDAAPPEHPLFFAIVPDATAALHIVRLAQHLRDSHNLSDRPLAATNFHITLHPVGGYPHGDVPPHVLAGAREAASLLTLAPFRVMFDRAMSFKVARPKKPLVLIGDDGVAALTTLHQTLGKAMIATGIGKHVTPSFTPHMTLLYSERSIAEQAIEPVSWIAREVVLVHSLQGLGVHIPLGRWPLRG